MYAYDIGGDFVLATRSNKGLWNIGAGMTSVLYIPSGFHVTTGYQWAFGKNNHRFGLKPSVTFGMIKGLLHISGALFCNLTIHTVHSGEKA
jgi:hypothetical protein